MTKKPLVASEDSQRTLLLAIFGKLPVPKPLSLEADKEHSKSSSYRYSLMHLIWYTDALQINWYKNT